MADQVPHPPVGPPADYFMTPPPSAAPQYAPQYPPAPPAPGFAMPPEQAQWQAQPGYAPVAVGAGVGFGLASQFSGAALSSCVVGLITIIVPFAFGWVFYVLPIAGILAGLRALQRGKLVGGAVGIGLNLIGGLVTIIALKG